MPGDLLMTLLLYAIAVIIVVSELEKFVCPSLSMSQSRFPHITSQMAYRIDFELVCIHCISSWTFDKATTV